MSYPAKAEATNPTVAIIATIMNPFFNVNLFMIILLSRFIVRCES